MNALANTGALALSRAGRMLSGRRAETTAVARPVIIRRRGAIGSLLAPIGMAVGLVIVGAAGFGAWNMYATSAANRLLHETAVKPSGTHLTTGIHRQIPDDRTEILLRLGDGRVVRATAGNAATGTFVDATARYIALARERAEAQAAADLDRVFAEAFASRAADLDAYADWFFAWGRSWRFLYEAGSGAVQEMARLVFSSRPATDAARHAAEDYLLRNYTDIVLKPAQRDSVIADGMRRALDDAHAQYLVTVAGLDARVQQFLAEKTDHLEEIPAGSVGIVVDWDAEKWKAPLYRAEDRFLEPVQAVAAVGGGAVLGGIVERAVLPVLARSAVRLAATAEMTAGGAAAGSIQPGLGTVIGAVAGAGLDWALNAFRAHMERDSFVAENGAALDATIAGWKARLLPELVAPIDAWYGDSEAALRKVTPPAG